jgi:PiT family inorganic phosphate transporter
MLILVIATILVALIFDFVNGMNDAANSIATIVSTRILTPRSAVIWAAAFNFLAIFIFGVPVAKTIGKGIVDASVISVYMVLAALIGAIIWAYFFCARFGIPVSSSHSLIGGLIGAGLIKGGPSILIYSGIFKILAFIVIAPFLGFVLGYLIMVITLWFVRRTTPNKVDKIFRIGQLVSSAAFSIGHGGNDAQKTMGIIALVLYSSQNIPFVKEYLYSGTEVYIPFWVEFAALSMISLGTLSGGMKIVKTMGTKLTHLKPIGGFSAETAGAATLYISTFAGIPVSTTQTIAGAIMGVGVTKRVSAVRWGIASNILTTWLLTIPASMTISALIYLLFKLFNLV